MKKRIKKIVIKFKEKCYRYFSILKPDPSEYSTIVGVGTIVPVQIEAYFLALNKYLDEGAIVLDVGFGLGYGMNIMSIKASEVSGVDVDIEVIDYFQKAVGYKNPRLCGVSLYDGYNLPFRDNSFDIVTCVDVIEHVEDYNRLIVEMLRVARKGLFISTPKQQPQYTNKDGTPKNYWHIREWSYEEFNAIVRKHGIFEWNFINGPYEGPFTISTMDGNNTMALSPFIFKIKH